MTGIDNTVSVDLETYWDKDGCSLAEATIVQYVAHPDFEVLLCCFHGTVAGEPFELTLDSPTPEVLVQWMTWFKSQDIHIIAHNAAFDQYIVEALTGWLGNRWDCSADLMAASSMPRSLAGGAFQSLGIEHSKEARNASVGKRRCHYTPHDWQKFVEYCQRDAQLSYMLWCKHSPDWPESERILSRATRWSGWRGVPVNMEKIDAAICDLQKVYDEHVAMIPWVGKPCPSGRMISKAKGPMIAGIQSRKAFAHQCQLARVPVPKTQNKLASSWHKWLEEHGERAPWALAKSKLGQITYHLDNFKKMRDWTYEGRFRFEKKYHGGHTGRWSGTGGFNMENLPRSPEPFCNHYLRGCITADPGKNIIAIDYSQIEPRVLYWLVQDEPLLELLRNGTSPYEAYAMLYLNWKHEGTPYKESVTVEQYTVTKANVISLGYGVGGNKLMETLNAQFPSYLTPGAARSIVSSFRAANGGITRMWKYLEQLTRDASLRQDRTLRIALSSGRVLSYENIKRYAGKSPNHRIQYTGETVKGGRRTKPKDSVVNLYGGLITENIVQATARDVLCAALVQILAEVPEFEYFFTVHDEIVGQCNADVADSVFERITQIMETPPEWAAGLPVAVEGDILDAYGK